MLVNIPALHAILEDEFTERQTTSSALFEVCHWLYRRGREVLSSLLVDAEEITPRDLKEEDWTLVRLFHFILMHILWLLIHHDRPGAAMGCPKYVQDQLTRS